jgi:hypothetical protein
MGDARGEVKEFLPPPQAGKRDRGLSGRLLCRENIALREIRVCVRATLLPLDGGA